MDRYKKFYEDFKRPQFAPIYRPTVDEFADPIAYVAKIKPEAEKYGVVKIVPPKNFLPPFAIDGAKFEFTPRVQKLNEIEASVRERVSFYDKFLNYWKFQGIDVRSPVVDNKYLDLYRLQEIVASLGGADDVTKNKQWQTVAKRLNIKTIQGGSKVKEHFFKLIHPYLSKIEESSIKRENESDGEEYEYCDGENAQQGMSMQSGKRRRAAGRMMAGGSIIKNIEKKKKMHDPMESVYCTKCGKGDNENKLLLCETCDCSLHTFCCEPPLSNVPKNEWHCAECSADKVAVLNSNFGFYDANTKYNLISFADFANKFKKDYFRKPLEDVSLDEVEKEFWKNTWSDKIVSVKYGADLRVDRVGSGFPRRCDNLGGVDHREKQHYAAHAWNLNNLPVLDDSVLSHIGSDIPGMMIPWVYVGMCFSTFCWHTEDHWTYSINYNHKGDRKVWYGISGADAEKFEKAVQSISPGLFSNQRDLLHHMTVAVNPQLLASKGVSVWTVHQGAGEFVITFPRAYHAGFNEGFNVAEAVNFAPIDWLRVGRQAVGAYADVRRTCVFSHEELVISMVSAAERLSISMSVAAYEELHAICDREIKRRQLVASLGVRESVKEEFEKISDELRECKYCHTTIFMSALTCPHGRLVCLDHANKLCPTCPYKKMTLKYRYELIELAPFLKKLQDRHSTYTAWRQQVTTLFEDSSKKPTLIRINELIEQGRKARFPCGETHNKLINTQKTCLEMLERVRGILSGKVRTRTTTRMQRADNRPTLDEVNDLIGKINGLSVDLRKSSQELENLVARVCDWSEKAEVICERAEESEEEDILDELRELFEIGEKFDIKLNILDRMERCVRLCEWRRRALKVLKWEAKDKMEEAEDFISKGRWNSASIITLIDQAKSVYSHRFETPDGIHVRLHAKMKRALVHTNSCEDWQLRGCVGGVQRLQALWDEVRQSDWLDEKGLNSMREEVVRCRELAPRLSPNQEISLQEAEQLLIEANKSLTLKNSPEVHRLRESRDSLISFTQRLSRLFHRTTSYFTLYDILVGREDLAPLLEGQPCPLTKREENRAAAQEWDQLDCFEDCASVSAHCSQLAEKQYELMQALRIHNERRSIKDSCFCGIERERETPVISCLLCYARFHSSCVEWDPFLEQFPPGSFLCVRCLRSRRPFKEDVVSAISQTPISKTFELTLVAEALKQFTVRSRAVIEVLTDLALAGSTPSEELKERLDVVLVGALGCEIVDSDLIPKISLLLQKVYREKMTTQVEEWEKIRTRPVNGNDSISNLFAPATKRKRASKRSLGLGLSSGKKKKGERPSNMFHDDDEKCEADKCLRPSSDHLLWVQCEAGCSRWYHYVCVGLTKLKATKIGTYACYRCNSAIEC
ncbi:unnamed protein product, partial [Mesorhabditis belari]|uniref:[histone H3]-trimethyl-L-lysine(4) demethylase n=1 Tax=Mesorhabditis belari TaxID=2138241 RepID=A0AAF3FI45_9BILA